VYPGLISVAGRLGRRVVAVATDALGMRPDALEQACDAQGATVLYLNPTIQNPVARTMPAARRRQLAKVAQRKGLRIIEDDPYWLFEAQAPEPVAALAPASTYYLSTLSKCLTPGLRTAYVRLPDAQDEADFLMRCARSRSWPRRCLPRWPRSGCTTARPSTCSSRCARRPGRATTWPAASWACR
jgi:DNA-binding transcriptional MocR family regulator